MNSSDFAALLAAVALASYLHAAGPGTVLDHITTLLT